MNPVHPKERRPQRIAVLPGDGTGKDVTAEAVKVLESAAETWDLPLELVHLDWDADRYLATGETMPAGALDDFRRELLGHLHRRLRRPPGAGHEARRGHPPGHPLRPRPLHQPAPDQALRLPPLPSEGPDGEGRGLRRLPREHRGRLRQRGRQLQEAAPPDEVAIQDEVHTRKGVERIIRAAFEYAAAHGRREVCMSDKSNVMRYGHDLWQRVSPRSPRSIRRSSRATCSWTP